MSIDEYGAKSYTLPRKFCVGFLFSGFHIPSRQHSVQQTWMKWWMVSYGHEMLFSTEYSEPKQATSSVLLSRTPLTYHCTDTLSPIILPTLTLTQFYRLATRTLRKKPDVDNPRKGLPGGEELKTLEINYSVWQTAWWDWTAGRTMTDPQNIDRTSG